MYQKAFQVTILLFLAIVSVAFLAILLTGLFSMFQSTLLAGDHGIVIVVGSASMRRVIFLVLAATLLICGAYVFFRRRRVHR